MLQSCLLTIIISYSAGIYAIYNNVYNILYVVRRVHHIARTPFTEQAIVWCGCSSFPCRRSRNIRHCWACIILLLLLSFYTIFILYFVNNTLNRGRWTYFLPSRVCADVQHRYVCSRARIYLFIRTSHKTIQKPKKWFNVLEKRMKKKRV